MRKKTLGETRLSQGGGTSSPLARRTSSLFHAAAKSDCAEDSSGFHGPSDPDESSAQSNVKNWSPTEPGWTRLSTLDLKPWRKGFLHKWGLLKTLHPFYLKVPYCTPFWSFILGFDVLKNIYLQYKYQKPSQYIFTALLSGALVKNRLICPV